LQATAVVSPGNEVSPRLYKARRKKTQAIAKPARPRRADKLATGIALIAATTTVAFSMVLNVRAFTQTTDTLFGTALGIMVPLWILAATFIGQQLKSTKPVSRFAYALAVFMLIVSLPHLAHGYEALRLEWWEGWSLAIVTDLTQIMAKMAIIRLWSR